uniref:Sigma-70 family RNA polymerase sigma factor n=1 Tax=Schlesneria paludicola TaxID=360056 RepID=A0A7C2JZ00_9PLAN
MLRGLQRQSDEDWRRFTEKYSPLVYRWCRRSNLCPEDAAEVTQETFIAILQHVERFTRADSDSTFRGWLWTITHRKICDLMRGRRRWAMVDLPLELLPTSHDSTSGLDWLPHTASARLAEALQAVRGMVEPHSWQAFWLTVVELRPTDDVAAELNLSPAAVRQAKYRTLKHLRTWWASRAVEDSIDV